MPKYAPRDPRQPRYPQPPNNIPYAKNVDAALSYMAKHRAFYAPKLLWEDRDSDGKLIASTVYSVSGSNHAPRGIKKCYLVRDIGGPESGGILFLYDHKTEQWYRNKAASLETEDHPLHPCTPPDRPVIALPPREFLYLMDHSVMDLLEAKINGKFDKKQEWLVGLRWSNKSGMFILDDEDAWMDWK